MAGPGENIEIQITGESKGLSEALEKVSKNIEELVAVLGGVKDSFEKTGKSAQDSMKKVETEAKKASDATDGLAKSTDKAKKSNDTLEGAVEAATKRLEKQRKIAGMAVGALDKTADSLGRMDSAFAAFSSVVDKVNPELAENFRILGDVAGASEQVILAYTQLGPKGLAIAGIAAGIATAWTMVKQAQQEIIDQNQELADGFDKQISAHANLAAMQQEMTDQVRLSTGAISQEELALEKRTKTIEQAIRAQKNAAKASFAQSSGSEAAMSNYLAEVERLKVLEGKLKDLSQAQFDAAQKIDHTSSAMALQDKHLLTLGSSSQMVAKGTKTLAVETVEGIGDIKAAYRMHNDALTLVHKNIRATNTAYVEGKDAQIGLQTAVDELNTALAALGSHESYSAVIDFAAGAEKSWGAVNRTTTDFIGIQDLMLMKLKAQADLVAKMFLEDQRRAAERKRRMAERLSLLEQLEERAFATENALKNPIIALEDAHEREMEQLDKLTAKYKGDSEIMVAAERIKVAAAEQTEKAIRESLASYQEGLEGVVKASKEALQAIDAISEGGAKDTFEEESKALEEYYSRQKELLEESVMDAMATEADTHDIVRIAREERLQIEQEFLEAKKALQDKYDQEQQAKLDKAEDERLQKLMNNMIAMQDIFGGIGSIVVAMDEAITYQSIESQKKMFAAAKAAAISEAVIAGAVAGIATFKDGGVTPQNILEAAALAITTAATVATIAAEQPSFDIGGVVRGGVMAQSRDQVSANLLPGEAVLNRRATEALGEQGVNALNSGGSASSQVVVVPAYKHFDRFIKDEYRRGGSFRNIVTKQREFPVGRRSY